jgi:hypothetical protein
MFDPRDPGPDYQLVWPPELFQTEARALLDCSRFSTTDAEFLLEEAFAGEGPRTDLTSAPTSGGFGGSRPDQFGFPAASSGPEAFLGSLAAAAETLPRWSTPRPYWSSRHGHTPAEPSPPIPASLHTRTLFDDLPLPADRAALFPADWVRLVGDLMAQRSSMGFESRLGAEGPISQLRAA